MLLFYYRTCITHRRDRLCHPSRHADGDLMRFDEKKCFFLCPFTFFFYLAVAVFLIVCIYFVTIIKSHDYDDGNDKDHPMNGTLNIVFFCCSFFVSHSYRIPLLLFSAYFTVIRRDTQYRKKKETLGLPKKYTGKQKRDK